MPELNIKANYFEFNGMKYFRRNADQYKMGSYGRKKDGAFSAGYLDAASSVKPDYLVGRVRCTVSVQIDAGRFSAGEFATNGSIKYFGLGAKSAINLGYDQAKSYELALVKFVIDRGTVQRMLNTDADIARNYLRDEGGDGRIVTTLWTAMHAKMGATFSNAASLTALAGDDGRSLELSANVSGGGGYTIVFENCGFAYAMHKVTDWNSGKTQIEDLGEDYGG